MRSMVRPGTGVAILPCYVGDQDPELRRVVSRPIVDGMMDLWVLFHPAIQRAARVRALSEYIAETVLADRDLFEGRRPTGISA
jgi:DNA-binding transcriptional LysR family regulator